MTASERRILTTILVGKEISEVMYTSKEVVRVAFFERTGLLITVIANEISDSNIRPQGMENGKFCIAIKSSNLYFDQINIIVRAFYGR